jgi:DNA replication protein DnaC
VTRTLAVLFFQIIGRRYEHASTVLTSNKSFEGWGEVLGDIRGNSYRMRGHADLWQSLAPAGAEQQNARRTQRCAAAQA